MREIKFKAIKSWQVLSSINLAPGDTTTLPITHLVQYTGLKDKNGVEIYEGDIVVKTDRWHEGVEPFIGEVVYDDYVAAFGIRDGTPEQNTTSSIDETRDKYEVIGNIYENPELVK